jgi:hypothetical protein
MKQTPTLWGALWMAALCVSAQAEGTPKIQFDQTVYDFGKTSQVATVSGVFNFKNAGDGILKVEPPKPSCGCTIAELKPDTLAPGATGVLAFTLNLGLFRSTLEKHIAVRSNDPQSPEVSLTIKADYTPLYDVNPMTLAGDLPFGTNETVQFTTISRTDGKPLHIVRLEASKPWITATLETGVKADDVTARIRVKFQRQGPPGRFNEFVQVFSAEQTNSPVSRIYLYGQTMGEVSVSPDALYWSITPSAKTQGSGLEAQAARRVKISSADGQVIELKNPQSTIKGIKVELISKEPGKLYELLARLDDVPASTVSGNVSFETSVAAQPRIELPVIVNVFKP